MLSAQSLNVHTNIYDLSRLWFTLQFTPSFEPYTSSVHAFGYIFVFLYCILNTFLTSSYSPSAQPNPLLHQPLRTRCARACDVPAANALPLRAHFTARGASLVSSTGERRWEGRLSRCQGETGYAFSICLFWRRAWLLSL